MKVYWCLLLIALVPSAPARGQDDPWIVDKISAEICAKLDRAANPAALAKEDVKGIFFGTINQYKAKWGAQLDGFPNSGDQQARAAYYCGIIHHRLLFDCEKYWPVFQHVDQNLANDHPKRKQYLTVRQWARMMEQQKPNKALRPLFEAYIDRRTLYADLDRAKAALDRYKYHSDMHIVPLHDSNAFFVNVYDFKTGEEYMEFTLYFPDTNRTSISRIAYTPRETLAERNSKAEETSVDEDLEQLMAIPPTTPPVEDLDSARHERR